MEHFTWFSLIPFLEKYVEEGYVHVLSSFLITIFCLIFSIIFFVKYRQTKKLEVPDLRFTPRTFLELISEMLLKIMEDIMGPKKARRFFPMVASVFIFIFLNNLLGLIPGFIPATENVNTTFAAGIFIFLYYNYVGFKKHGFSYLKQFLGPVFWLAPIMIPIELVSHTVRPMSLGLRLFGNMLGDHIVLSIFNEVIPVGVPIVFLIMGLFVAFFQSLIFTLLSVVYLTLAVSNEH